MKIPSASPQYTVSRTCGFPTTDRSMSRAVLRQPARAQQPSGRLWFRLPAVVSLTPESTGSHPIRIVSINSHLVGASYRTRLFLKKEEARGLVSEKGGTSVQFGGIERCALRGRPKPALVSE